MLRFFTPKVPTRYFPTAALISATRSVQTKPTQWADITPQPYNWGEPVKIDVYPLFRLNPSFKIAQEKGHLPLEMYAMLTHGQRHRLANFFLSIPNAMDILDNQLLTLPEYLKHFDGKAINNYQGFKITPPLPTSWFTYLERLWDLTITGKPRDSHIGRYNKCCDGFTDEFYNIFNPIFIQDVFVNKKTTIRQWLYDLPEATKKSLELLTLLADTYCNPNTQKTIKQGYITLETLLNLNVTELKNFRSMMDRIGTANVYALLEKQYFSFESFFHYPSDLQTNYIAHIKCFTSPLTLPQFASLRPMTQAFLMQKADYRFGLYKNECLLDSYWEHCAKHWGMDRADLIENRVTLEEFIQLSEEEQKDLHLLVAQNGLFFGRLLPLSALLTLPHETRMLFLVFSKVENKEIKRGCNEYMDRIKKFLRELDLANPVKLAQFQSLNFAEQQECFACFQNNACSPGIETLQRESETIISESASSKIRCL